MALTDAERQARYYAKNKGNPEFIAKNRVRAQAWWIANPDAVKARALKWQKQNPNRRRDIILHHRYRKLPHGQYDKMFEQQCGVCKICGRQPSIRRALEVDHSHKTGEIRGLLCHGCNAGLGFFRDDAELLARAAEYLRELDGTK